MKKVKLCVAALLIGGYSYGQCTSGDNWIKEQDNKYENAVEEFKSIEYQIEDIVDAIRMDMYYGHLTQDKGNYYINEVMTVKIAQRQIMADLWRKRNITLGEHQAKLN